MGRCDTAWKILSSFVTDKKKCSQWLSCPLQLLSLRDPCGMAQFHGKMQNVSIVLLLRLVGEIRATAEEQASWPLPIEPVFLQPWRPHQRQGGFQSSRDHRSATAEAWSGLSTTSMISKFRASPGLIPAFGGSVILRLVSVWTSIDQYLQIGK